MCIVCTDWLKNKMTNSEALRALGEMVDGAESGTPERTHYIDILNKILDKEMDKDSKEND